ncbi:hypothetical protein PHAVU_008G213100 [Phaseolus vulgaris]|uniref:Uncharacterized protein n=1 Tax=Phaseolus vulgaris TaxID=3885 RepID=V7B746_PHAVU|nr:hypothetical protein PHAVU_008G213100g [Phaseolus vulgaris]ESW13634.1 hypothetical protein PHAVU_008G213100g [Phaseolus vulgaris]
MGSLQSESKNSFQTFIYLYLQGLLHQKSFYVSYYIRRGQGHGNLKFSNKLCNESFYEKQKGIYHNFNNANPQVKLPTVSPLSYGSIL